MPVHLVLGDAVEPSVSFQIRFSTVIFIRVSGYLEDINGRCPIRLIHRERIDSCFLIRNDPFVRALIIVCGVLHICAGRYIARILRASVRIVDPPRRSSEAYNDPVPVISQDGKGGSRIKQSDLRCFRFVTKVSYVRLDRLDHSE